MIEQNKNIAKGFDKFGFWAGLILSISGTMFEINYLFNYGIILGVFTILINVIHPIYK